MASWCPDCGYYPAIDGKRADAGSWADEACRVQPTADSDAADDEENLLKAIAPWMWVMIVGMGFILLASVVVKTIYHDAGLRAGTWSWGQLILGVLMIMGAHGAAAVHAMRRDRRLVVSDIIVGWVAIWQPTVSMLPDGHKRIWSLAWGATFLLGSLLIIGDHNFSQIFAVADPVEKDVKKSNVFGKVVGKAAAVAKKNGKKATSLEDALKNIAEGSELQASVKALEELTGEKEAFGEIFGYLPGENGLPSRVLICSLTALGHTYSGRVSAVDITPEALKLIAMKVVGEECEEPFCACDESAIWVKPSVRCRLRYTNMSADGQMSELQLVSVVRDSVSNRGGRNSKTGSKQPTSGRTKASATGRQNAGSDRNRM